MTTPLLFLCIFFFVRVLRWSYIPVVNNRVYENDEESKQ